MVMLDVIDELLTHIKDVQMDVIDMSNESLMKMSTFMEKNGLEIDEDITITFQYQDIITQQLNATSEAILSMQKSIEVFSHAYKSDENLAEQSLVKLEEKLTLTLQDAKDNKSRFSGKRAQDSADEEIEFF